MFIVKKLALLLLLLLFVAGCGDDESTTSPTSNHLTQGWSLYESGNYTDAITSFVAVLEGDPANISAFNGLGWTWTKIGNMELGRDEFQKAIDNGMTTADPYAGIAFASIDIAPADFNGAISSALTALEISSDWSFSHKTSIDWRDLRLVLAQSYFAIHNYELANEQVVALGGTAQGTDAELMLEITRLNDLYAG
ncbi:MAG: tetratricopeptide repeat protein [bacterium]|nr:tetratricopeptide repeat protein [bacterium]MCP4799685.1 tetratricopeptide repeat protein [bacterium]